ncbi:MAG: energy transducer TonB [Acinetobacter populi]|jgi:TonB family protein|uniref:energy transducer TonB n=1 Tax=Acinetobacter populi TaxID=1582270 RepID=UPI00235534D3|nr:energy transducer TonB [Acinetobacter populi]MCH4248353.1 energy transducer TonB [Acinetobacter populi]
MKVIYFMVITGLMYSQSWADVMPNEDFLTCLEQQNRLSLSPPSPDRPVPSYVVKPKIIYPKNINEFGNKGEVDLGVLIDKMGHIERIKVLESIHPDLEQAAVQGMLKAQFPPSNDTEARCAIQKVGFGIQKSIGLIGPNAVDPFKMPKASKKLPEHLQYDEPPVIKVAAPLVYPLNLLQQNEKGKAKVYVLIDPTGKVLKSEILSASSPEFGLAAKASLQAWEFYPAKKDQKNSWSIITKEYDFNLFNRDSRLSASASQILEDIKKNKKDFSKINDLDQIPKPLYAPMPAKSSNGGKNYVQIEFYLDKDGLVQLPTLLSYDNEEQAWLALTAIKRWQFEVPKINGQPVIAKLVLPLQFQ